MQDFDLVVIGAGVAGLTAAMTAARYGLKTVVIDRMGAGGQVVNAERIENFPGFPQGLGGHELGPLLHEQAEAAGAEFLLDTIETLEIAGDGRIVRGSGDSYRARAVIIAVGSAHRALGIPGEEKFLGRGVSHCASCDAPLFAGKSVCVIGGGDSAVDEALVLAPHVERVTVFHREAALGAQKALLDRLLAVANVSVELEAVVEEILGGNAVAGVRVRRAGTVHEHHVAGVFIFAGLVPNTAFLRGTLALDPAGHVETDIMMQSSVAGVFAAGDVRRHSVAQLAACAGDGATAAVAAVRYVKERR